MFGLPRRRSFGAGGRGAIFQGNPNLSQAVEDLRRQTFTLIERVGAEAGTAEERRAIVELQRVAYELGCVETLLGSRVLHAA